eukprot:scaffold637714_cov14-Prasinocladus_malaysianus.AAC.1
MRKCIRLLNKNYPRATDRREPALAVLRSCCEFQTSTRLNKGATLATSTSTSSDSSAPRRGPRGAD